MSSCPRDISENLNMVFVNFRKLIKLIRDLVNNNSQDIHAKITFLKKLNAKFRSSRIHLFRKLKSCYENFRTFLRKHPWWSLLLVKLQVKGFILEQWHEFVQLINRSSRPKVFCKKVVLKSFAKFTGKHLCQRLFLKKLQVSGQNISKNTFFYRAPSVAASVIWIVPTDNKLKMTVTSSKMRLRFFNCH